MKYSMKQICNEIESGSNLEVNLPQYMSQLSTLYEQFAEVKFILHYYTFYENLLDKENGIGVEENKLITKLNQVIHDSILTEFSGDKMENNVKMLDSLRNQIIKEMHILTAYTDVFQNYEYVLNRIEYRFSNQTININEEEITAKILNYIFETKDNVIINDRIKEMIGELPVRMTKTKYFDIMKDSLANYEGMDVSSVNNYLYMIKSSAMLYHPEGIKTAYPDLKELKIRLETCDYKNITEEEYHVLNQKIAKVAEYIKETVDFYYALQEVINHLYVMILMTPYAFLDQETISHKNIYQQIVLDIYQSFQSGAMSTLPKETEEKLCHTEGLQENFLAKIQVMESVMSVIRTKHMAMVDSIMLGRSFQCLCMAEILLGSSLFVEFNSTQEDKIADRAYITQVQEELIELLTELFQNNSKNVYRAVVANTINKMPVFFQSINDIQEYIKGSLESCRDFAEKAACINIINSYLEN